MPFLDPVDGVICVPATITPQELHNLADPHGLRYPLILDPHAPLIRQTAASPFAPASSRFGPFCDNIMGMNWKLPSGRIMRIGERVVKSTTGYDLLRFFLNSSGRFGEPVDYVLRLRPDCGTTTVFQLTGISSLVTQAVQKLLASCWIHWFDSVDLLMNGRSDTCELRISLNCPDYEQPVYLDYLANFASQMHLAFQSEAAASIPTDGCPDIVMKTTPDQAIALSRELAAEHGLRCVTLCYNGVIHGYFDGLYSAPDANGSAGATGSADIRDIPERIADLIGRYSKLLTSVGGDWQSRHLPAEAPSGVEAVWLKQLDQEFGSL